MVEERATQNSQIDLAIEDLKKSISDFQGNVIQSDELLMKALGAWLKVNGDPVYQQKLDNRIRDMRVQRNMMSPIDIRQGDPIKKRYDPNLWMKSIPSDLAGKPYLHILDRSKALLDLFEAIRRDSETVDISSSPNKRA